MASKFILRLSNKTLNFANRAKRAYNASSFRSFVQAYLERHSKRKGVQSVLESMSKTGPRRVSGQLRDSITARGLKVSGYPAFKVGVFRGPALEYAAVQEYGTRGRNASSPIDTIRPVRKKALAYAPKGSPAVSPTGLRFYESAREYPLPLKFVPFRKSGIAIGALYNKRQLESFQKANGYNRFPSRLQAVYILLKETDISPTKFLTKGFKRYLPLLVSDLSSAISEWISTAGASKSGSRGL